MMRYSTGPTTGTASGLASTDDEEAMFAEALPSAPPVWVSPQTGTQGRRDGGNLHPVGCPRHHRPVRKPPKPQVFCGPRRVLPRG
jgi:hypothetical protein